MHAASILNDMQIHSTEKMAKMTEIEGHRLHLKALARQERDIAYRRHHYLSHEWQMGLRKDKVKEIRSLDQSPFSVIIPSSSYSAPEAPSEICARWRDNIIDWKYQVVDRFGETHFCNLSYYLHHSINIHACVSFDPLVCTDLDREIVSISTFYLDKYLSMHYVDEEVRT